MSAQSEAATATPAKPNHLPSSLPLSLAAPINLHRAARHLMPSNLWSPSQTLPAPPFPSRPPATGRQPTDAVATTAARSNPWRERAEAAGSVLERLILGSSSSDRVPWREESRKSKGGFFVLSRVSSADSAFLGSGNEAARVAAPVPPSPGSSSLKFRAFFSLAGVP